MVIFDASGADMKRLAVAGAVIALIATPAFAQAPPPAPAPVYSWTGFYAGLNAGWSWGKDDTTVSIPGPPLFVTGPPGADISVGPCAGIVCGNLSALTYQETTKLDGAIGGVQIGYNWQATPSWVLGIEADIQASGEDAQGNPHHSLFSLTAAPTTVTAGQTATHNDNLLWFGTARGRIGYAAWPTVMVYGTGGLAYGRFNDSVSSIFTATKTIPVAFFSSNSPTFDASTTKTGWTVGGGIEGAVPSTHVTWKAEYLYMDLGTRNFTFNDPFFQTVTISSHFTDHIFRVGLNQFH
jgi:outer membrane immunogenic protein